MRIISGKARGRKLKSSKQKNVRPTLDRVKEAIFNIISSYLPDKRGLDLFAGFGNLGLEAISRGAKEFTFVEKDYRNVKIIKENINLCGFAKEARIVQKDVFKFLKKRPGEFDLILMDPPYRQGLVEKTLELIVTQNVISPRGIIVAEHESELFLEEYPGLIKIKYKKYGETGITIYQAEEV